MPDPIEDGLRRMNRMTIALGLEPMKAIEIEKILNQAETKKPIRGIKKKPSQNTGGL